MSKIVNDLNSLVSSEILIDEPMRNHTSFKIGGPCDIMVIPQNEKEVIDVIEYLCDNKIEYLIIGNGSNLLVRDKGIRGVVVKLGTNFGKIEITGDKVFAEAGALLSTVSKKAIKESLTGMEALSGIPGSIGGAVTMNAGAYGPEMIDVVESVKCITRDAKVVEYSNEEMHFRYRGSRVEDDNLIVLSVVLKLKKGDLAEIMAAYDDYTHRRTSKQPLEKASAGSTFKRPSNGYASAMIDEAGLRGFCYKDAQVSEKHCGFVINRENAKYADIIELVRQVKERVYEKFGVILEMEVKIIGEE